MAGEILEELPDGLENLRKYNLLTYKSIHEPLDSWAIDELISYYVLYRKIISLKKYKKDKKKNDKKTKINLLPAQFRAKIPGTSYLIPS